MLKDDCWLCDGQDCKFTYRFTDIVFHTNENFLSVIMKGGTCPYCGAEIPLEQRYGMVDRIFRLLARRIAQIEKWFEIHLEDEPAIQMIDRVEQMQSDLENTRADIKSLDRYHDRRSIIWSTRLKELIEKVNKITVGVFLPPQDGDNLREQLVTLEESNTALRDRIVLLEESLESLKSDRDNLIKKYSSVGENYLRLENIITQSLPAIQWKR